MSISPPSVAGSGSPRSGVVILARTVGRHGEAGFVGAVRDLPSAARPDGPRQRDGNRRVALVGSASRQPHGQSPSAVRRGHERDGVPGQAQPFPARLQDRLGPRRRRACGRRGEVRGHRTIRLTPPLRQGSERAAASGLGRRRPGRPLLEPPAIHGGRAAPPSRRLPHRLAQRPGRAARRRRFRARRLRGSRHRLPAAASDPAHTCSPCASRARLRWWPRPSCPRAATRRSPAA